MTTGEKIKKFRLAQNLSQKQLAYRAGMSEPTIRNYELGNRIPSRRQLEKVARALQISVFALSDPHLDAEVGIMHAFFYLEDKYKMTPEKIDGRMYLTFPLYSSLSGFISEWNNELDALTKGDITKEEYDNWRYNFPYVHIEQLKSKLLERTKQFEKEFGHRTDLLEIIKQREIDFENEIENMRKNTEDDFKK